MRRKPHQSVGLILLTMAMLLFGPMPAITKPLLEDVEPLLLGGSRNLAVGVILLLVVALSSKKRHKFPPLRVIAISVGFTAISIASYSFGLQKTNAIVFSIVSLLPPIFVYLGAISYLKEYRSLRALFGALVGLVGAFLLIVDPLLESTPQGTNDVFVGNLLAIVTAVAFALIILHSKKHQAKYGIREMLAYRAFFAGIFLSILSIIVDGTEIPELSSTQWLQLGYYVVMGGVVANLMLYKGLSMIRAEDSSALFYLDPLVGFTAAVVFLGESLQPVAAIGAATIVAGTLIAHPIHIHVWHHAHTNRQSFLVHLQRWLKNLKI